VERRRALTLLAASALAACGRPKDDAARPAGPIPLVLKHQPLWGSPAAFRSLLARFEQKHPGVQVLTEALPSASDVVHQYFLTALEGGARDFDVFVVDVVWTAELARAGWIADLSGAFPPDQIRRVYLPGAAASAVIADRTVAVPWYVDVGILYRRADLCPEAPRTCGELVDRAIRAVKSRKIEMGHVFQGKQYEGLTCCAFEAFWAHGAPPLGEGRVVLDGPEARAGLAWMRSLLVRGASPSAVTSMAEEESRRVFQDGRALFMRNWPYAIAEAERPGSQVRGKVAVSALPTESGDRGAGALGGYHLALNARSPAYKREAAEALIAHLTSASAAVDLAIANGRNPARRDAYQDGRLVAGAPQIAALLPMLERARARPTTPYYPALSDTLQAELSAAITGVRSPAEALARAQALADHLAGGPS
jgi:multiple sugar transport system substrate-binding protein